MMPLKIIEDSLIGQKYKPGLKYVFKLAIPCVEQEEYGLLVEHDGQNDANVNALLRLADEGKAPYCISLGIMPGMLEMPNGSVRNLRMNSYDLFDREYGDFIVHELIPYITEKYKLRISPSPDLHLVSGASSGGISAFVVAWFQSAYFHKVYMCSPSFLAMGRGNEIPYLIRKYETKPLKIYEEWSENEPNDYFGWSRAIDDEARAALVFSNYDFRCKYFAGEGHSSRYRDEEEAYIRMKWLFEETVFNGHSSRVEKVIPKDSRWTPCAHFPKNDASLAVRSNDGVALYCGDRDEDVVYMIPSGDITDTDARLLHATLHTVPRIHPRGAIDMAVDRADRLYVLTAIGIQCVRSFGLIDVILELPDATDPIGIAVADALYVKTANGIYRRELQSICIEESAAKRKFASYYD